MTKRFFDIFVLLVAIVACAYAQNGWTSKAECEKWVKGLPSSVPMPYYYCECHVESQSVSMPFETTVRDTMWFSAGMNELRKGMTAYWFSEDSVAMEVYAFCTDKTPLLTTTIGGNKMQEIDATEIRKQIDNLPSNIQSQLSALTPHLRVYPRKKGSGHVYCFPYDQGPVSTCEAAMPIYSWMTYVCNTEEEYVYRLDPAQMDPDGHAFIHWKHRQNYGCELRLTLDSCTGEEIGSMALSDSLHVYIFDSTTLVNARNANRPIWLHVTHEAGKPGRITYYAQTKFKEPAEAVNKSICAGKKLNVNGRDYWRDTTFIDTVWVTKDTLQTMPVALTFTLPQMEYDTIHLTREELKAGYRSQEYAITLRAYGDTLIERTDENTCSRRILLTVAHPTALDDVADGTPSARKQLYEGQIWILLDDKRYNVLGQQK